MNERGREAGFTLVEVMVALLIFGMIAAAGVGLLAFSVQAQAATGARLDQMRAIARLGALMTADFAQALDRPARDERGVMLPAFVGDAASVTLVRGGWSNPDMAARPGIQKVSYRRDGDAIERTAWPMTDGAAPLPPAPIVTGIRGATLRYRFGGAWSDRWGGSPAAALPQAIELTIARTDGVVFRQSFLVGTGAPKRRDDAP